MATENLFTVVREYLARPSRDGAPERQKMRARMQELVDETLDRQFLRGLDRDELLAYWIDREKQLLEQIKAWQLLKREP